MFIDPAAKLTSHLHESKPLLSKFHRRVCLEFDDPAQATYARWLLYHLINDIPCPAPTDDTAVAQPEPCPDCHGDGKQPRFSMSRGLQHTPCPTCNGTGKIAPASRMTDPTGAK